MSPQAPSTTGLATPVAPTGQTPVSPSGAPGVPALPQGTTSPAIGVQQPQAFDTQGLMSAIANYYQIPKQTALASAGVEQNKFNATTAYEGQVQAQSEFAKEQLDESKYKIENTPNGVNILDPVSGQPVDIGTFVNRTGANPAEVLKASPNQRDQQFVSDYNNFQQYLNAAVNAKYDKNGKPLNEAANVANAFASDNPNLQGMTPQQAAQTFLKEYGNYFGVSGGAQPAKAQYAPNLTQNDINYLMSRYIYTGNLPAVNLPGLDFSYLTGGGGGASSNNLATLQQQIQAAANQRQ